MADPLTILQRTNFEGFPKPGELIEITGAHQLEAPDRAILNLLYQHAHDSGRMGDILAEWEIPISALRVSRHESTDRIRDSLARLMRVIVTVPIPDRRTGEPRILQTHLFDFFDTSADEASEPATVRFGLPKKLQPILTTSNRWGRIKAEVVCSMTSRYSIALYELVQLRANMDRCVETFPLARFRDLLGVPPDAYGKGSNLNLFVIEPSILEVNGLSDMGVAISPVRKHRCAPTTAFTVTWWRKEGDDFRAAMQERSRSKMGRIARLRGQVETIA